MVRDISYIKSLMIAVALMVGGWAMFNLVKLGVEKILIRWGIISEFAQYGIIILVVMLILALAGFGVKKAIKKLVRG